MKYNFLIYKPTQKWHMTCATLGKGLLLWLLWLCFHPKENIIVEQIINILPPSLFHLNTKRTTTRVPKLSFIPSMCECCQFGKQHQKISLEKKIKIEHLKFWNSFINLCGPLKPSLSGSTYFITFTNEFLRKSWL